MGAIVGTIVVCPCCMLCHANGECCAEDHEHEPLSRIPQGHTVTMGVLKHNEDCAGAAGDGCVCDQLGFYASGCEGCGDPHHGDRYALVLWDERPTEAATA